MVKKSIQANFQINANKNRSTTQAAAAHGEHNPSALP